MKTKFNVGDKVYLIYNDTIIYSMITKIVVEFNYNNISNNKYVTYYHFVLDSKFKNKIVVDDILYTPVFKLLKDCRKQLHLLYKDKTTLKLNDWTNQSNYVYAPIYGGVIHSKIVRIENRFEEIPIGLFSPLDTNKNVICTNSQKTIYYLDCCGYEVKSYSIFNTLEDLIKHNEYKFKM